jgi:septal ring factor EnvC (AmiA/AmiB activator)
MVCLFLKQVIHRWRKAEDQCTSFRGDLKHLETLMAEAKMEILKLQKEKTDIEAKLQKYEKYIEEFKRDKEKKEEKAVSL